MTVLIGTDTDSIDLADVLASLNRLLRLRTTPVAMKLFDHVDAMEAVPRIRRPSAIHTTDQIVGMAARNGWTVGITAEDLVGTQCRAVIGLSPHDEEWLRGERYEGVWYADSESASSHQKAMDVVPFGRYQAMAVSPMASGRLDPRTFV